MSDLTFPAASPDDLDLEIGRLLLADELGSKDVGDDEARAVARRWFATQIEKFRLAICSNSVIQNHLSGANAKTRNELFAAVADALLASRYYSGVPVATLSARLIHYGVEQVCPGQPSEASHG
jgi:hypothetical protein